VSDRVRMALLGLGLGIAPLLLLDLAQQLSRAAAGESGTSTSWWALGVFVLVGVVVALGVVTGRRDRLSPAIGAAVLGLAVLPGLPGGLFDRLPDLPVVTDVASQLTGTVLLALGAYLYAAVRGGKA
jgi:hypothetical protein